MSAVGKDPRPCTSKNTPQSGEFIGRDGNSYNIVDLIEGISGGGGSDRPVVLVTGDPYAITSDNFNARAIFIIRDNLSKVKNKKVLGILPTNTPTANQTTRTITLPAKDKVNNGNYIDIVQLSTNPQNIKVGDYTSSQNIRLFKNTDYVYDLKSQVNANDIATVEYVLAHGGSSRNIITFSNNYNITVDDLNKNPIFVATDDNTLNIILPVLTGIVDGVAVTVVSRKDISITIKTHDDKDFATFSGFYDGFFNNNVLLGQSSIVPDDLAYVDKENTFTEANTFTKEVTVGTPTKGTSATTKDYVDSKVTGGRATKTITADTTVTIADATANTIYIINTANAITLTFSSSVGVVGSNISIVSNGESNTIIGANGGTFTFSNNIELFYHGSIIGWDTNAKTPLTNRDLATKDYVDNNTPVGNYVTIDTNQTITGKKAFTKEPTAPTPTAPSSVATKEYVDNHSSGGFTIKYLDSDYSVTINDYKNKTTFYIQKNLTLTVSIGNNVAVEWLSDDIPDPNIRAQSSQTIKLNNSSNGKYIHFMGSTGSDLGTIVATTFNDIYNPIISYKISIPSVGNVNYDIINYQCLELPDGKLFLAIALRESVSGDVYIQTLKFDSSTTTWSVLQNVGLETEGISGEQYVVENLSLAYINTTLYKNTVACFLTTELTGSRAGGFIYFSPDESSTTTIPDAEGILHNNQLGICDIRWEQNTSFVTIYFQSADNQYTTFSYDTEDQTFDSSGEDLTWTNQTPSSDFNIVKVEIVGDEVLSILQDRNDNYNCIINRSSVDFITDPHNYHYVVGNVNVKDVSLDPSGKIFIVGENSSGAIIIAKFSSDLSGIESSQSITSSGFTMRAGEIIVNDVDDILIRGLTSDDKTIFFNFLKDTIIAFDPFTVADYTITQGTATTVNRDGVTPSSYTPTSVTKYQNNPTVDFSDTTITIETFDTALSDGDRIFVFTSPTTEANLIGYFHNSDVFSQEILGSSAQITYFKGTYTLDVGDTAVRVSMPNTDARCLAEVGMPTTQGWYIFGEASYFSRIKEDGRWYYNINDSGDRIVQLRRDITPDDWDNINNFGATLQFNSVTAKAWNSQSAIGLVILNDTLAKRYILFVEETIDGSELVLQLNQENPVYYYTGLPRNSTFSLEVEIPPNYGDAIVYFNGRKIQEKITFQDTTISGSFISASSLSSGGVGREANFASVGLIINESPNEVTIPAWALKNKSVIIDTRPGRGDLTFLTPPNLEPNNPGDTIVMNVLNKGLININPSNEDDIKAVFNDENSYSRYFSQIERIVATVINNINGVNYYNFPVNIVANTVGESGYVKMNISGVNGEWFKASQAISFVDLNSGTLSLDNYSVIPNSGSSGIPAIYDATKNNGSSWVGRLINNPIPYHLNQLNIWIIETTFFNYQEADNNIVFCGLYSDITTPVSVDSVVKPYKNGGKLIFKLHTYCNLENNLPTFNDLGGYILGFHSSLSAVGTLQVDSITRITSAINNHQKDGQGEYN